MNWIQDGLNSRVTKVATTLKTKLTIFLRNGRVDAPFLDHDDQPPLGILGAGQPDPGGNVLKAEGQERLGQALDARLQQGVLHLRLNTNVMKHIMTII